MTLQTMYAWSRPLAQSDSGPLSNIDHTWVTIFETKVDPDKQPDDTSWRPPEGYWYCWGVAHKIAERALRHANGNAVLANSIAPSNKLPPKSFYDYSHTNGSIEYYGLDGVCHHVANQVLAATGTSSKEPIRVKAAKGYPLSTFFYGNYGLNEKLWNKIKMQCVPDIMLPDDDFLRHMNKTVTQKKKRKELLKIRSEAREKLAFIRTKVTNEHYNFLPELSLLVSVTLFKVTYLLGWGGFKELFPLTEPEDTTWLLQPTDQAFV